MSNYVCYICSLKLVRSFPKILQLAEKVHDEVAGEKSGTRKIALENSPLDNKVLSSGDNHDVVL